MLVKRGKARGVVLAGGEEIRGKLVVSNADVKRTFLKLVEEKELPEIFLRRVRNFKIRGSSGKVNIALDSMPEFPALAQGFAGLSRRHAFHRFDRAHGARL